MNHRSSSFPPTACFSVQGQSHPQMMPRVLELFAKRGLVPASCHAATAGTHREELHIDLQVEDMGAELAEYVAQCLRQVVGVDAVLISEKSRAQRA